MEVISAQTNWINKASWAFNQSVQGVKGYFKIKKIPGHIQEMGRGLAISVDSYQKSEVQETIYGTSRVAIEGLDLFDTASNLATKVSQTVANSSWIQSCRSFTDLISTMLSLCDGFVASLRLSWMIQATDTEIAGLTQAQLQRRLGDAFPLADIEEFKRTNSQDILLRMRTQAKRNLYFRSFQVSIASLSLATTFTGIKHYKTAATVLANTLFAQHLYENRSYYAQLALDTAYAIPGHVKSVASAVAKVAKTFITNIDWFFEFSVALQAAKEARKRGDWQEIIHASLRIITNTLQLFRIPGVILSNLNIYIDILDKIASSQLLSFLTGAGIGLSIYSFCEGTIASLRLAWMIFASDKEIEAFSEHQLSKRLGPSFEQDIALFNKITQIPESKRTAQDQMILEKLLPEMRAQAKRKLCIRLLQVTVAALSIAAFACTFAALPHIALPLSILAITLMAVQIIMDGAWAENRGHFSLLNFLPISEQKDFEAMAPEELANVAGTNRADLFKLYVQQKNEIGLMNIVPEMQELAKRKTLTKMLFIGSVVGAVAGVVAVAIGAFPIAIGLAITAALLLALNFFLSRTWEAKEGEFSILALLPSGLEQKVSNLFYAKQLREEAALKEHYPWLQEVLQPSHKIAL